MFFNIENTNMENNPKHQAETIRTRSGKCVEILRCADQKRRRNNTFCKVALNAKHRSVDAIENERKIKELRKSGTSLETVEAISASGADGANLHPVAALSR